MSEKAKFPPGIGAAIARQSLNDELNATEQMRAMVKWGMSVGITIPRQFQLIDNHTSGRQEERPAVQWVLAQAANEKVPFRYVVAYDKARFTRQSDPDEIPYIRHLLKKRGIQLVFMNGTNPSTVAADAQVGAVFQDVYENTTAGRELEAIRKRTRTGTKRCVTQSLFVGTHAPYGTKRHLKHRLTGEVGEALPSRGTLRVPDHGYTLQWASESPRELMAVQLIFERLDVQRATLAAIAGELQDGGYPVPHNGSKWTAKAVAAIASNPLYMGDYVWNRGVGKAPVAVGEADPETVDSIIVPGFMADAPVDSGRFQRVQEHLRERRQKCAARRGEREYLLSTMLRCGRCGSTFNTSGRGKYYRHQQVPGRGVSAGPAVERSASCPHNNRYLPAGELEGLVLGTVRSSLADPRVAVELARAVARYAEEQRGPTRQQEREGLEKEIRDIENRIRRGHERLMDTDDAAVIKIAKAQIQSVQERLEAVSKQLSDLDAGPAPEALERTVAEAVANAPAFLDKLAATERAALKPILATLIKAVHIDLDKSEINVHLRLSNLTDWTS